MKYFYPILFLALLFSACSKEDNSSESPTAENNDSAKLFGETYGEMEAGNGNISNSFDGTFRISESGKFFFDTYYGFIEGNASQMEAAYNLENLTGGGIFENSKFQDGTIDTENGTITISGSYLDSSPLSIEGDIEVLEIFGTTQELRDISQKSSIWFTHNELCKATISIDGEIFENLGSHYSDGGMCSDLYGGPTGLFGSDGINYVDDTDSQMNCDNVTIWDPIGQEFRNEIICASLQFIADKNSTYTYSIAWENGDVQSGTVTSADGAAGTCVHLGASLEGCEDTTGTGNPTEVIADFDMVPNCCPPVTLTGRHFNQVEMQLLNYSEGEGLESTWFFNGSAGEIIGGTADSPTVLFSIPNNVNETSITVTLAVVDSNGNFDSVEKSITLPVLTPAGSITIDGETCEFDLNFAEFILFGKIPYYYRSEGSSDFPGPYYQINIPGSLFEALECSGINFNQTVGMYIRIGGLYAEQVGTLTQTENINPAEGFFYVNEGLGFDTFEDEVSFSSGGVTLSPVDEGTEMIATITLEGQLGSLEDPVEFSIELNWIANICYYSPFSSFCTGQPG